MNTNWNVWVLGPLIALAFAANAAVLGTPRRPRPTVEELIESKIRQLKDPAFTVRRDAALTLASMHRHARKVVPALIEALQDEHPAVREAAELALGRIAATARESVPELPCFAMIARDGRSAAGGSR